MKYTFIRKETTYREAERLIEHEKDEVVWLSSPMLDKQDWLASAFSTRLGGVSTGETASMNLSFVRDNSPSAVLENYTRLARAVGIDRDKIVCSAQTHTVNVKVVTAQDAGCGVIREKPWTDIDALITDVSGLTLTVFSADCVPLLIADPVHHAIGAAHSGWRGTIEDIAGRTLQAMHDNYGTQPEEVVCAIGPSICADCYEVSDDVAGQFLSVYADETDAGDGTGRSVCRSKGNGKYLLDLWEACRRNFIRAGVPETAIAVTDICTHCNSDLLFSHRTQHGKQGTLGALICIR